MARDTGPLGGERVVFENYHLRISLDTGSADVAGGGPWRPGARAGLALMKPRSWKWPPRC